jgi:hypothetical protein
MKTIQKIKRTLCIFSFFLVFILTFSACSIEQTTEYLQNEIPTTNQPLSKDTEAPTSNPDPIPDNKKEILNQVLLFLNSEEPYRQKEDIYWLIFRPEHNQYEPELGILSANIDYGNVHIQGAFLGWAEASDGIVLFIGVQDEETNRFVTPLKLYDENYEIFSDVGSGFTYLIRDNKDEYTIEDPIVINTKNDVENFLTTKIGKVLGFQLAIVPLPPLNEADNKDMLSIGWKNPELAIKQINSQYLNYLELNKNLSNSLWVPSTTDWKNRIEKLGTLETATKIESPEDIDLAIQTKWLPSPDYMKGTP